MSETALTPAAIAELLQPQQPAPIVVLENTHPATLQVNLTALVPILDQCYRHPQLYFDQLSCLTVLDQGPQGGQLELLYTLNSIPFGHHLTVQAMVPRGTAEDPPIAPSVAHIWRTADWHEREAFDLFGVRFEGHPDLRRILLPHDWEGHPLRKDYEEQEVYHGIRVAY